MRVVLDLDRLVREGRLSPQQAAELKALAARDTGTLAINLLLAFGCVVVAAGVVALEPSWAAITLLGAVLAAAGLAIMRGGSERWRLLGAANLIVGTLAAAVGIVGLTGTSPAGFAGAAVLLAVMGVAAGSGLLVAFAPVALAFAVGSGSGYEHARYMLVVREATIMVVLFLALAWLAYRRAERRSTAQERLALIFARMSLILANLGFWVGSLFGDAPGWSWYGAGGGGYALVQEAGEGLLYISALAFVIVWALFLFGLGIWAARTNRRFVLFTAVVFGAIHFYTQWFERLGLDPVSLIAAGLVGIGAAVLLWRATAAGRGVAGN